MKHLIFKIALFFCCLFTASGSLFAQQKPYLPYQFAWLSDIHVAGPDMVLSAIDAQNGTTAWRIGNPKLNEALGISEDGSKVFVKCTYDSTLLAYSTISEQPQVLWKTKADDGFDDNESPIAEKDGVVYFTFHNGEIIAANSDTGKILWEHRLSTVMLNSATPINKDEVVVSDVDGNVELLSIQK